MGEAARLLPCGTLAPLTLEAGGTDELKAAAPLLRVACVAWAALGQLEDAARGYELLLRAKGKATPSPTLALTPVLTVRR